MLRRYAELNIVREHCKMFLLVGFSTLCVIFNYVSNFKWFGSLDQVVMMETHDQEIVRSNVGANHIQEIQERVTSFL